jgi:hypothetical protein
MQGSGCALRGGPTGTPPGDDICTVKAAYTESESFKPDQGSGNASKCTLANGGGGAKGPRPQLRPGE